MSSRPFFRPTPASPASHTSPAAARTTAHLPPGVLADLATRQVHTAPGALWSIEGHPASPALRRQLDVDLVDELVGVRAEPHWLGLVLVLAGITAEEAIHLALALDRSGRAEAASLPATAPDAPALALDAVDGGFVVDVARRMLGLPTGGQVPGTQALVITSWLEALLHTAADPATAAQARRWSQVAALHPLVDPADDRPPTPGALARLTRASAQRWTWERLHRAAVDGSVELTGLSASEAAWMDPPFFARWMLSVHRPVTELLDDLSLFMDGPTLALVQCTVEAVGWLGFAGRDGIEASGDR